MIENKGKEFLVSFFDRSSCLFTLLDVLENGNCVIKKHKPFLPNQQKFEDVNGNLVDGRESFEVNQDWFTTGKMVTFR